jgi:hypothetical protein
MGGLIMENYDLLMKGGAHGKVIVPSKADESRMILMLEGKIQPRMPFSADALSSSDIGIIKAWISSGAAGPAPGEAIVTLTAPAIPEIRPQVAVVSPVCTLHRFQSGRKISRRCRRTPSARRRN